MAVALTDAIPLMASDGVTGRNTGRSFRKFVACLLLPDVKSANPLAVRNGVLPHNWDVAGSTSMRVQQQTTAAYAVDVLAGGFVCERSGQGPYIGWSEATVSIVPATSNATNARVDVVYAWVGDQVSIGTDPVLGPVVDILTGTPSASPVAPTNLPDGAVVLAQLTIPAGASTIPTSAITDKRMSSALTGAVRHLLPGDAVTDAGRIDGELRFRTAAAPYPALVDYWDSAQSLWRGTTHSTFTAVFPGTPDSGQGVSGTVSGLNNILITLNVPDPGFPYRLEASGLFWITSMFAPTSANIYVNVNNNAFAGCIANWTNVGPVPIIPTGSTIYTGASVVRLKVDVLGGGSMSWGADVRNALTVQVKPA